MKELIKDFKGISKKDTPIVGGKNASLGAMYTDLSHEGVKIPNGFATTAFAYETFIEENNLTKRISSSLSNLDRDSYRNLQEIGENIRNCILEGEFSPDFSGAITSAYHKLGEGQDIDVAVRSSATAEDLPEASFAGQHDTFLNVKGTESLLIATKNCMASLFTDRAIKYREDQNFDHLSIALSVGVQKMVRSDLSCSGIGFTIDPESGFKDIIHITGVWGLGENIVQGNINPDEFYVFKPTLQKDLNAIIQKKLGSKEQTMVYALSHGHSSTLNLVTEKKKQETYILSDPEILQLAKWALKIENFYNMPMDIEWAKDGNTQELFITQARPETIHGSKKNTSITEYTLKETGKVLASGNAIGNKIATGIAKYLQSPKEIKQLRKGDILVTNNTSPDWDPIFKMAGAIVTNKGGRTSHAAIVARELGVPAIVGTVDGTQKISSGQQITVSCAQGNIGNIYSGELGYEKRQLNLADIYLPRTKARLILSNPDTSLMLSFYPNHGVGLLRMEFIIAHIIKAHPMALVKFDSLQTTSVRKELDELTRLYENKTAFFIDKLSQGIAMIAAAFYPKQVLLRTSDFKTNEYAKLLGGAGFEPSEEKPMLGLRGASRYYNELYQEGFKLECTAIKNVREEMGLTNLKVMIPFCRTPEEGKKVVSLMKEFELEQGVKDLEIYMMVEIPSNVMLLEEFAQIFDGFSIGSNDLTQLTLGIDRDSEMVAHLFDENNAASKKMISLAIQKAKKAGKPIGFCGQAPSDDPDFAKFLIDEGIDSISFNSDALLEGIQIMNSVEKPENQ